jgi:methyl-accepting chemotaxis protein
VEEINSNLGSLDRIAVSNAAASEEITATVIELSKLAEQTRQDLGRFSV